MHDGGGPESRWPLPVGGARHTAEMPASSVCSLLFLAPLPLHPSSSLPRFRACRACLSLLCATLSASPPLLFLSSHTTAIQQSIDRTSSSPSFSLGASNAIFSAPRPSPRCSIHHRAWTTGERVFPGHRDVRGDGWRRRQRRGGGAVEGPQAAAAVDARTPRPLRRRRRQARRPGQSNAQVGAQVDGHERPHSIPSEKPPSEIQTRKENQERHRPGTSQQSWIYCARCQFFDRSTP